MDELTLLLTEIRAGQDYSGAENFFNQGMLDSLDMTALVAALESRFNVFLDVDEIVPDNLKNLSAIKSSCPQRSAFLGAAPCADHLVCMSSQRPHIAVCICTYNRPDLLKRLLTELDKQETGHLFTYSAVVADNDPAESARQTIGELDLSFPVKYCAESRRGIAYARNKVIENAEGDFVAFIDDDEFPVSNWLLTAFKVCDEYGSDGVFGPVKRHFDVTPPDWMRRSRLYDRRVNPTGTPVEWTEARTGNVLLKKQVLAGDPAPFRPEFRVGEDQDFFRRKIEKGFRFVWSADAVAFEVVPPARWDKTYLVQKALLRGSCAALQPTCGPASILKSVVAIPLYTIALPFGLLLGQHRFMGLLVKVCDHLGKVLALMGIHPIKEAYVSEKTGA